MKRGAEEQLPQGFSTYANMNLVKNKRQLRAVAGLSLGIASVVTVVGLRIVPISALFAGNIEGWLFRLFIALVGMSIYMIGHEAVHGLAMWLASGQRPRFGLTLRYAYAGSDAYFRKGPYLCIALLPALIWGALLTFLCLLIPPEWFWVGYASQIFNLSGSAGDFYVAARVAGMPNEVLVRDSGTEMTAYLLKNESVSAA